MNGGVMFPSSGDPEEDARIAAGIRRREGYLAEGLCPNGCAALQQWVPADDDGQDWTGVATCPTCGFVGSGPAFERAVKLNSETRQ